MFVTDEPNITFEIEKINERIKQLERQIVEIIENK